MAPHSYDTNRLQNSDTVSTGRTRVKADGFLGRAAQETPHFMV